MSFETFLTGLIGGSVGGVFIIFYQGWFNQRQEKLNEHKEKVFLPLVINLGKMIKYVESYYIERKELAYNVDRIDWVLDFITRYFERDDNLAILYDFAVKPSIIRRWWKKSLQYEIKNCYGQYNDDYHKTVSEVREKLEKKLRTYLAEINCENDNEEELKSTARALLDISLDVKIEKNKGYLEKQVVRIKSTKEAKEMIEDCQVLLERDQFFLKITRTRNNMMKTAKKLRNKLIRLIGGIKIV